MKQRGIMYQSGLVGSALVVLCTEGGHKDKNYRYFSGVVVRDLQQPERVGHYSTTWEARAFIHECEETVELTNEEWLESEEDREYRLIKIGGSQGI